MNESAAYGDGHSTRILIVLLGALGDVVRGLSIVDALRASGKNLHITWMVEPASEGIVRLHPGIDDVIVFRRREWKGEFLRLWRTIRGRFDVTLDLQRHFKSGFLSWISGSPRRIGFHPDDAKEFNWLFNTEYVPHQGEELSKIDHYLTFVAPLGVDFLGVAGAASLRHGLADAELPEPRAEWSEQLKSSYIVLVLGSSWESKDWPEEGYRALITRIVEGTRDYVVLVGDKSKTDMAERMAAMDTSGRILTTVGKTSLSELVAILRGARACVGPDSGPGHIAGALGTPYVALFGPTSPKRNSPRGSERFSIVSPVPCSPCKRRKCPGLGQVCMRLISPESVYQTVKRAAR